MADVTDKARSFAEERILAFFLPAVPKEPSRNPFEILFGGGTAKGEIPQIPRWQFTVYWRG